MMTAATIRNSTQLKFNLNEIKELNKIFENFEMNRLDYKIQLKDIQKKNFDFKRKHKIKKTEQPITDVTVLNSVYNEYKMAQNLVDLKIYTLDHDNNLWMINFTSDVFVPYQFNDSTKLSQMGMHILKSILDKNYQMKKHFKFFPTLSNMIDYQFSHKKMNEEHIYETIQEFSLDNEFN